MILRASKQRLRKRALFAIGATLCIGHLLFFYIELRGTVRGCVARRARLAAPRCCSQRRGGAALLGLTLRPLLQAAC
jgi:hypothetical protein